LGVGWKVCLRERHGKILIEIGRLVGERVFRLGHLERRGRDHFLKGLEFMLFSVGSRKES